MDAEMVRHIHTGHRVHPDLGAYPAHLHIDLLPIAQGGGWGRKMIETLLNQMRARGVSAVHLGVGAKNQHAIGFYEHVGFHIIQVYSGWVACGMDLTARPTA